MTAARLSQLQKRILRWLVADHQRTQGSITSSHQELVRALQQDKGNIIKAEMGNRFESWAAITGTERAA